MFNGIEKFIQEAAGVVWGMPMVAMLGFVGILYTVRSRFFQFRRLKDIFKSTFGSLKNGGGEEKSAFKAMATALGGTIGVGNIAGVATAIVAGGAGAVFWMWISGFIGMMTKLAEVCVAMKFRRRGKDGKPYGGPFIYIIDGLGKKFAPLAVFFAVCCVLASLGMGSMTQSNAVGTGLYDNFGVPPLIAGIAIAIPVFIVISGGFSRVSSFTGVFVPLMSVFYMLFSVYVIVVNRAELPSALSGIFTGAFGLRQVGGGVAGFAISRAMKVGISRGVFTNEAGMGSSPIAHASAEVSDPFKQSMWGAVEVFLDTIVVCTMTALVILTSGAYLNGAALDGVALTTAAFTEVMGGFGGKFIAVSVTFFAFASTIGWAFYGEAATGFLLRDRMGAVKAFRLLFCITLVAGAVAELSLVWNMADILNGLMALPNIIALVLMSPVVFKEIDKYDEAEYKKKQRRKRVIGQLRFKKT